MFFYWDLVQVYRIKLLLSTVFSSCKYVISLRLIALEYCCLVLLCSDSQWGELIVSISQVYENLLKKTPDKTITNSQGIVVVVWWARLLSSSVYSIHLSSDKCSVMFPSLRRDVVNRLLCLEFVWEFDTVECFGNKLGNTEEFILNHGL